MAKILVLVFTLVALTAIADSKPLSNAAEAVLAEEAYKRLKRADAPDVINSVSGLVNGILDTNWRYIAQINADKLKAQEYDYNHYGSRNNNNQVMPNNNEDYEYNHNGNRNNNNRVMPNSNEDNDYNDNGNRNNNNGRYQRNYNRNNNYNEYEDIRR